MSRPNPLILLVVVVFLLGGCTTSSDTAAGEPTTATTSTATSDATTTTSESPDLETSTTLTPVSYPGGASFVTGRIADFAIDDGTVTTNPDGTSRSRDGTITYTLVSDDARVAGTVAGTWHSDRWGHPVDGAAITQWGEATITNENGTWEAPYTGIWTSAMGDVLTRWWQGSGDYEGLTFYMAATGTSNWEWVGLIYPGTPPPGT